jgi:hypothetical protein
LGGAFLLELAGWHFQIHTRNDVTRSVTVAPMRAEVRTSVLAAWRCSGIHAHAPRSKTKRFRGVYTGMKVVSHVELNLMESLKN